MTISRSEDLITEAEGGVLLRIHLQPRASRTELCGQQGNELKVRVTSPPVDDAANRLCIEFFADLFSIAKSKVTIRSGSRSRHKVLHISGASRQSAADILNLEIKST